MNVVERVLENRLRRIVTVDEMQFSFVPVIGAIDAVFILRRIHETYHANGKKLYMCFVDLEEALYGVPKKMSEWAMRKNGIPVVLVRSVMSMFEGAKTRVGVDYELSEEFEVKVGMHRGSVLKPFLFALTVDFVTEFAREGALSEFLYANDLVLMSETIQGLRDKFLLWKGAFESKELKVNLGKPR